MGICEEELILQGFKRCTLLYTNVAGSTVLKSRFLKLCDFNKNTRSGDMVWNHYWKIFKLVVILRNNFEAWSSPCRILGCKNIGGVLYDWVVSAWENTVGSISISFLGSQVMATEYERPASTLSFTFSYFSEIMAESQSLWWIKIGWFWTRYWKSLLWVFT